MSIMQKLFGKEGAPSFFVGVLFNGAVVAAVVAGVLSIYGSWFENKQRLQSDVVLKLLAHDTNDNRNVVSAFRTLAEIGVMDEDVQTRWEEHAKSSHDTLPRFYYSGFIWSVFHPHVATIKQALATLGFYKGDMDGKVNAAFVLATMRAQSAFCIRYIHNGGKSDKGEKSDFAECHKYADGIVGKGTLHEISILMKDIDKTLVLE